MNRVVCPEKIQIHNSSAVHQIAQNTARLGTPPEGDTSRDPPRYSSHAWAETIHSPSRERFTRSRDDDSVGTMEYLGESAVSYIFYAPETRRKNSSAVGTSMQKN